MSEIDNLHSLSRQYLSERFQYWTGLYGTIDHRVSGGDYSDIEKGIFPRYNVLSKILDDVERFVPGDFADLNEERLFLAESGRSASSAFSRTKGEIAEAAANEERELFVQFVTSITDAELLTDVVLPLRRTPSEVEVLNWLDKLGRLWGTKDRAWYPMTGQPKPKDVDVLQGERWRSEVVDSGLFSEMLEALGSEQVIEIREYGSSRQEDPQVLIPDYDGAEGLFTDLKSSWLIYASHEWTITIGGEHLRGHTPPNVAILTEARWTTVTEH